MIIGITAQWRRLAHAVPASRQNAFFVIRAYTTVSRILKYSVKSKNNIVSDDIHLRYPYFCVHHCANERPLRSFVHFLVELCCCSSRSTCSYLITQTGCTMTKRFVGWSWRTPSIITNVRPAGFRQNEK